MYNHLDQLPSSSQMTISVCNLCGIFYSRGKTNPLSNRGCFLFLLIIYVYIFVTLLYSVLYIQYIAVSLGMDLFQSCRSDVLILTLITLVYYYFISHSTGISSSGSNSSLISNSMHKHRKMWTFSETDEYMYMNIDNYFNAGHPYN